MPKCRLPAVLWFCLAAPVCLAAAVCLTGCDAETTLKQLIEQATGESGTSSPTTSITLPARDPDSVRIASFNIQVFGTSKSKKKHVMKVLADVIRQFDVVAIQEIRSKDKGIIPRFVEQINAGGARYDYVVGPRLGRTSSKEQYAYLFDTERIEIDRNSVYTVSDRNDLLHREPLVARFRVRGPPPERAFTFTVINIHTDPDETDQELDALDDVFVSVVRNGSREDDIILLGDLNVDEKHLGELGRLPNIDWAISGVTTNTRGTKSYDNIVFNRRATVEFNGQVGVFNFVKAFGLSLDEALEVSDHLPVWAEFSAYEDGRGSLATGQPAAETR